MRSIGCLIMPLDGSRARCSLCGWTMQLEKPDSGALYHAYHQHLMEHTRRSIAVAGGMNRITDDDQKLLKGVQISPWTEE